MKEEAFRVRFTESYRSRYNGADPAKFSGLDFVGALGCTSEALLYSRLFLPNLMEIDGMIFLSDSVDGGPDGVRDLHERYGHGLQVEKTLNYFQINLNFPNRVSENMEGDDRLLAEQLADSWALRLQHTYPGREFVMEILDDDGEAAVSFHQKRWEFPEQPQE